MERENASLIITGQNFVICNLTDKTSYKMKLTDACMKNLWIISFTCKQSIYHLHIV